jgi:hypothetical protein
MKRIKTLMVFLMALLILGGVSVPSAQAQALNNVWLKLKVNVKGFSVDSTTGKYRKSNGGGPGYLHFAWDIDHYDIDVWTRIDGVWTNAYNTTANTNHPGENFIADFRLRFFGDTSEDYIDTAHTPLIKYTYKQGALRKVTYQGTGEIMGGEVGGNDFYGYFNIQGISVDPSKLPFAP